ncbi:MAG TPA: DUF4249 domain-containing protein [Cryomorphaceae bacterium]|nr:DUF4249 domain-containing protein [Cryomorphaceae bacterium]
MRHHFILLFLAAIFLVYGCEKNIEIDVPPTAPQIVVEGNIETGQPPIVLLSRTNGFFEPVSAESIAASYISDADVRVNGISLDQVCVSDLPEELRTTVSLALGIPLDQLSALDVCAYIGFDNTLTGQENTSYKLEVDVDGEYISAVTHIPGIVQPDSVWFRLWADSPRFGFLYSSVTDPDTLNNAYRVFTRRLESQNNDNPADRVFYAPLQSAFIDEFFNGQTAEVTLTRGMPSNSTRPTDQGESEGFFESGDRVILKFCSTDEPTYQFFRTFDAQQGTNGSPFSAPSNIISNIDGGLGIWAGYAAVYDTLYAIP